MKYFYLQITLLIITLNVSCAQQENPPNIEIADDSQYYIEKIADGIDIPWGMTFINNNEFLVTDRDGLLYHVGNGKKTPVEGLPEIHYNGQGGLLDLAIDNNFNDNNFLYFTASIQGDEDKGSNTALYRMSPFWSKHNAILNASSEITFIDIVGSSSIAINNSSPISIAISQLSLSI